MTTRSILRSLVIGVSSLTLIAAAFAGTPGPCTGTPPVCTAACGAGCVWTVSQNANGAFITATDTAGHNFTVNQPGQVICVDPSITVQFQPQSGVTTYTMTFGINSLFGRSIISGGNASAQSADNACSVFTVTDTGSSGVKTLDPKVVVSGSHQLTGPLHKKKKKKTE